MHFDLCCAMYITALSGKLRSCRWFCDTKQCLLHHVLLYAAKTRLRTLRADSSDSFALRVLSDKGH